MKLPPTFTNGIQYSSKILMGATALAAAQSNFSLNSAFLPASSALACTVRMPFSPSSDITHSENLRALQVNQLKAH